ncbi:hypothetical protein H4R34_000623 [Dimargaris verticillata]|uniref:CBS domain-containing protein n=1 Tax=Dimargaris verticillata TaxID=2761393 RepID=A0A9W8EEI3_9FUNG|nr:hypothetical protein H4R34_000623 [Dimargaris verticillata]
MAVTSLQQLTPAALKPLQADVATTPVTTHLQRRALVAAPPTITVAEALRLLATHNILSLPIYSHYQPDQVANIVTIHDILSYVTALPEPGHPATATPSDAAATAAVPSLWTERLQSNIEAVMTLDASKESYRFFACEVGDTLAKTLQAFASGMHRALVKQYSPQGDHVKPSFILTQTDVVRYVHDHPETVPESVLAQTVEQAFATAFTHKPLVVPAELLTLHALRRMDEANHTAAAVVDSDGTIVGNLSASDLRGLTEENLALLNRPVMDFLQHLSPNRPAPVTVTASDTLKTVMAKIHANHVHRTWVVDHANQPITVITLTDLLQVFNASQ